MARNRKALSPDKEEELEHQVDVVYEQVDEYCCVIIINISNILYVFEIIFFV